MKLEMDLRPEGSWGKSLANLLPTPVWNAVRREIYQKFNYICAICSATDVEVHCHEVWSYDDRRHIQFLKGLQCLCKQCHQIKHWGRTVSDIHKGILPPVTLRELTDHFCRVNGVHK